MIRHHAREFETLVLKVSRKGAPAAPPEPAEPAAAPGDRHVPVLRRGPVAGGLLQRRAIAVAGRLLERRAIAVAGGLLERRGDRARAVEELGVI